MNNLATVQVVTVSGVKAIVVSLHTEKFRRITRRAVMPQEAAVTEYVSNVYGGIRNVYLTIAAVYGPVTCDVLVDLGDHRS